jgi:hypothetical protein
MSTSTIKLTVNASVLAALKRVMPKTTKAQDALDKYIAVLERHLEQSLMYMDDNMYRFFKHFYVSTHALSLEVGQFVIDGRRQYLHQWLEINGQNLIRIVKPGIKGGDFSLVLLTELVSVNDVMDINQLRKKSIDELDAWLNDTSLTDTDFFYKVFPDFLVLNAQQLKKQYDLSPVNVHSLQQFIVFLTKKANMMNDVQRQLLIRQAQAIVRIARAGTGDLPMKKKPSHFGRTYYTGVLNVQSMKKTLRHAMLGNCWSYDIRLSVIAWKLGFSWLIYSQRGWTPGEFNRSFSTCLRYLGNKKNFREAVRQATFGISTAITQELQLDVIKSALTAISFGARKYKHGWIDQSGNKFNPAIVSIIADHTARQQFYASADAAAFMAENKDMDSLITKFALLHWPALAKDTELQTKSGRISNSKLMSYLYQQSESIVMDIVRREVDAVYKTVLANVHDAIYLDQKLHSLDKQRIEMVMRRQTGLQFWYLDEEKITGYKGVSDEVRQDELAHRALMAQQQQLAQGYQLGQ